MFFAYGHGGTRKNFLWNTFITIIHSEGKIALAVASSRIASLLLPGGRTTHSRFEIPLNVEECSTCQIKKQTQLAQLIEHTTLIVWNQAPMIHKQCLKALIKTLQDLLSEKKSRSMYKTIWRKSNHPWWRFLPNFACYSTWNKTKYH